MRAALDRLYASALALSAAAFAAIAVLVLIQILGRLADRIARWIGAPPPGITIPSLAEIGGFLFLAAVCLGLAGTFVGGGHVRVSLLTHALPRRASRAVSMLIAALGGGLAAFATWSSWTQALDSWAFASVSYGMIRIPLWIPQGAMTLGLALLCLALIDTLVVLARGGTPPVEHGETGGHA